MVNSFAVPVMAFDAKMVVCLNCKPGVAVTALKNIENFELPNGQMLAGMPYWFICLIAICLYISIYSFLDIFLAQSSEPNEKRMVTARYKSRVLKTNIVL